MAESKTNFLAFFRPRRMPSKDIVLVFDAPQKLDKFLAENLNKKMYAEIHRETGVRTPQQNSALHLGLGMIASSLNDSGLDMRKVLKPDVSIPWTTISVKEYLWRPVQKLMTGKESTRDLDKVEDLNKIWDTLMRFLSEKHGMEHIPFPSKQVIHSS